MARWVIVGDADIWRETVATLGIDVPAVVVQRLQDATVAVLDYFPRSSAATRCTACREVERGVRPGGAGIRSDSYAACSASRGRCDGDRPLE